MFVTLSARVCERGYHLLSDKSLCTHIKMHKSMFILTNQLALGFLLYLKDQSEKRKIHFRLKIGFFRRFWPIFKLPLRQIFISIR